MRKWTLEGLARSWLCHWRLWTSQPPCLSLSFPIYNSRMTEVPFLSPSRFFRKPNEISYERVLKMNLLRVGLAPEKKLEGPREGRFVLISNMGPGPSNSLGPAYLHWVLTFVQPCVQAIYQCHVTRLLQLVWWWGGWYQCVGRTTKSLHF